MATFRGQDGSTVTRSDESSVKIKALGWRPRTRTVNHPWCGELAGKRGDIEDCVNDGNRTAPAGAPLELLLADDFFFAVHDDVNGKVRLTDRGAGLGLAAGLLGELVLFRKITLERGHVVVIDNRPVRDALVNVVLEDLLGEPEPRPVRDWLRYLSRSAYDMVGQRMMRRGLVRMSQAKVFRRAAVYRPVDLNAAAWPIVRIAQKLGRREQLVLPDVVLAGLIMATGLAKHLRAEAVDDISEYLGHLVSRLPTPLRVLVAETEAAIGEAVLHHRM
jgi:hypothetical protein